MSEENQSPVGEPTDDSKSEDGAEETRPDGVSYDTHRKLLGEKKRLAEKFQKQQEELEKYREEKAKLEEQRLRDAGDYETLKQQAEERAKAAEEKLTHYEQQLLDAKKLNAIVEGVNGNVPKKFYGFIDTSSVLVDPETGEIDSTSLAKAVETFQENFPELIQVAGKNFPAAQAPQGKAAEGKISFDEFLRLPKKERKEKIHLVDLPEEAKFML